MSQTATLKEISARHRELAKKNHPDLGGSETIMKAINEAYTVLTDPVARDQYDMWYKGVYLLSVKQEQIRKRSAELLSEMKNNNTRNTAYDVSVSSEDKVSYPPYCACCMGRNTTSFEFYSRTVNRWFTFPYCNTCKSHLDEFKRARIIWIVVTMLASIIYGLIFMLFNMRGFLSICALNIVLTTGTAYMASKLLPLTILNSRFATRTEPVRLHQAEDGRMVLRFYNSLYARKFAYENNSTSTVVTGVKKRRAHYLYNLHSLKWMSTVLMPVIVCVSAIAPFLPSRQGLAQQHEVFEQLPDVPKNSVVKVAYDEIGGLAPITVINGFDDKYIYVKVIESKKNDCVLELFVHPKEKVPAALPFGRYVIRYGVGKDWNWELSAFLDGIYLQTENVLEFSQRGVRANGYNVKIFPQVNPKNNKVTITQSEFLEE